MADIFVCYRRGDSRGDAGRLADSLDEHFRQSQIFRDVESLEGGTNYKIEIENAISKCVAMLAVIGPRWLDIRADDGSRRLDNPDDFIVLEIGAALANNVTVIPVLVGGAEMPSEDDLPEKLKPLASRQAIEVSDARWDYDVARLIARLTELPGLRSRWHWLRRFTPRSALLAVPLAIALLMVVLAVVTQITTRGAEPVLPDGLQLLDVDLRHGADSQSNCVHPPDCDTRDGGKASSMIRLNGSDVRYDAEAQRLHLVLTLIWVLREGKTNLFHRGYTGKIYYTAVAQPSSQQGRLVIGEFTAQDHSLKPFNGLLAYTLGWLEIPFLLGRDTPITTEIRQRLLAADAIHALAAP